MFTLQVAHVIRERLISSQSTDAVASALAYPVVPLRRVAQQVC
jgi:hypothetical protein